MGYLYECFLSSGLVWRLSPEKRGVRATRYLLRCLSSPAAASRWSSALRERPELRFWQAHNPRFVLKPSRCYLSRAYSFSDRLEVILHHYALLARLLSPHKVMALATGEVIALAIITGKRGGRYGITLRKTDKFDREGELILGLRDATRGCELFHLVFSLNSTSGAPCLEIGCVQGASHADARELIRGATKECHGIRPKELMLEAAQCLAKAWNIGGIFGVSNEFRAYNSARTYADYDAYWREIGGVRDRNGFFRLPVSLKHHDLADVPSHHRSEHRKRMSLRGEVAAQIALTLGLLGESAGEALAGGERLSCAVISA